MEQPVEIAWYVYAAPYAYALFVGHTLSLVTNYMYDLVGPDEKGLYPHTWQASIIGMVERTLYLSSLLAGYAAFIGLWVGLKLGVQYKRWSENGSGQKGHTLFMNNLVGNGLSILYAAAAYGIIEWVRSDKVNYAIGVPILLVVGTLFILVSL